MEEYSKICQDRYTNRESQNPNGSMLPFVQISKDLKWVEIVVIGIGAVYKKKIGDRDPSIVETEVLHHAKDLYQF